MANDIIIALIKWVETKNFEWSQIDKLLDNNPVGKKWLYVMQEKILRGDATYTIGNLLVCNS